jgi:hypothetical protein
MLDNHGIRKLLLIASILSLVVLCFIAYGEILGYYFTSMDAFPLLLTGKIDSLKDIFRIFSSPLGGGFPFGTYYRPVSELSYGIDYLIWGRNPMGYHLTNILLHLANSFMVFVVAFILFREYKPRLLYAWFSSVLFLLSPLNAFLVPSITERQEMLAALLLCLSLLSFIKMGWEKRQRKAWYTLSVLFGFLAIFSKESAFVLPILIWFLSFIFDEVGNYRERAIRAVKYSIPFIVFTLLNTILHIYLFKHWGVRISSGVFQHLAVAAKSFFFLVGPIELLQLSLNYEILVFLIIFFIVSLCLVSLLFVYGVRGFLDVLLSRRWRVYTFLIFFILIFMVLFAVTGKAADYYNYSPNIAFTILIVMVLIDTFRRRIISILIKSLAIVFVIYTILYSPIFTMYSAWQNSSEITKQTIKETEVTLNSNKEVSRIYLINWPGFIGLNSSLPGKRATILVGYSMNAWAEWAGIKSSRYVEFIPISYALFPPGNLRAKFNHTFLDKRIIVDVEGCVISFPRYPYKGDMPFEFKIGNDERKGELVFNRRPEANEMLLLYDNRGIKVIGNTLKEETF